MALKPGDLAQGDVRLLEHPVAKELLASNIPARLAYVATDGTPRVLPIWFHWDGRQLVMGTPPNAAKLTALTQNPKVAVTIDDNTFPHKVLLIRGTAHVATVEGVVPEWAQAAERYFAGKRESMGRAHPREDGKAGAHSGHTGMGRSAGFRDAISTNSFGMTSKGLLGAITPKHFDVRENLHPTKELRRDYTIRFARRRYLIG